MNSNLEGAHPDDDAKGMLGEQLSQKVPARVLIVDDSRASADALGAYLQGSGMTVRTVYHGSDAIREAKTWVPDCIILDVAMPGLSGIGVAAALRRMVATRNIPLLAFTAFDTADYSREMKEVGFDAICRKPAELSLLERMIHTLLVGKPADELAVVVHTGDAALSAPIVIQAK
ncbi:response regulator [Paraburkholderia sp. PREW-6R]|uniref:response regulator n=1 Tax=Paraburkholderia sp. PREW-6R TaxID=3141544 RepID=UPI0031F5A8BC